MYPNINGEGQTADSFNTYVLPAGASNEPEIKRTCKFPVGTWRPMAGNVRTMAEPEGASAQPDFQV